MSHEELYTLNQIPNDLQVIDIKDPNDEWSPSVHQSMAVDKILLLHRDLRYATATPAPIIRDEGNQTR